MDPRFRRRSRSLPGAPCCSVLQIDLQLLLACIHDFQVILQDGLAALAECGAPVDDLPGAGFLAGLHTPGHCLKSCHGCPVHSQAVGHQTHVCRTGLHCCGQGIDDVQAIEIRTAGVRHRDGIGNHRCAVLLVHLGFAHLFSDRYLIIDVGFGRLAGLRLCGFFACGDCCVLGFTGASGFDFEGQDFGPVRLKFKLCGGDGMCILVIGESYIAQPAFICYILRQPVSHCHLSSLCIACVLYCNGVGQYVAYIGS